jgi:hypothetical protein
MNYYLNASTNQVRVTDINLFKNIIERHVKCGAKLITDGEKVGFCVSGLYSFSSIGINLIGEGEDTSLLEQLRPLIFEEPLYYFQIGFNNCKMDSQVIKIDPFGIHHINTVHMNGGIQIDLCNTYLLTTNLLRSELI